ncbi:MAG: caspase family protein [Burkholderiales bacterium]|uniref:Caspase family protein n=1 Tax=Janthinobacterium tructae TaxID=2590869 RepID=A0A4Y6RIW7_9BURK|nr:caspase family protein [Janthinobacterium tructae]MBH1983043.1 caspase family protein [Burkholderiales bacterium]MBH1995541.1 caspase family protein [Burkholderiales bacterium]MBH2068446.1 caspase family protein [Burkholderiales bacterium]QDG72330.1 caspase family protein [Janthinobacterium tructae]
MHRLIPLFFSLLFLLGSNVAHTAVPAAPSKRIALVIGNAAYPQPLLNPVNDARAMAERLRRLGFEVLLRTDITAAQLQKASAEFSTQARGADIALVFYAGHGAQAGEANYVLPLGANMNALSAAAIAAQGVSVSSLAGDLQRTGARGAVLILDACRQEYTRGGAVVVPGGGNAASHGFADTQAPRGVVIAYSAGPGALARDFWSPDSRNSPYTSALLDALDAPGLPMGDVFSQVAARVAAMTHDVQKPRVSFGETSARLVLNMGSGKGVSQPTPGVLASGNNGMRAPVPAPAPAPATTASGAKIWPGNVLQDINYEIRMQIAARPFPRQQLEKRARGGDLVALTALGYGIGGGDAGVKQPKAGMQWLEKAAAKDFPIAQTYLAELLMVKGDPASLKRAGVLLDAASQAGYSPAHAYKFDLARRTGAPPQDAARHLQDAFMGLMKDYQGAAKDVLQPPKK